MGATRSLFIFVLFTIQLQIKYKITPNVAKKRRCSAGIQTLNPKMVGADGFTELWQPSINHFFKWTKPRLFLIHFWSFQTNNAIFATNICEEMSIHYMMPVFGLTTSGT